MSEVAKLQNLLAVAERLNQREEAALALALRDRARLDAIQSALRGGPPAEADENFAARARWLAWADRKARLVEAEAAELENELVQQRRAAGLARARCTVLEEMIEKARGDEIRDARRRAENLGLPIEK